MIGDVEPASRDYPRLPNAAKEIALISQSFAPGELRVRSGPDAVPASYLESSPSHFSAIHFAVHANASRENPLESALILAPGPSGYTLTAREVMSVPLKADLVTLSACRGAGAKTYSGEGLVGLSWAFLRAGAGSVVAGLWDVTDGSTAKLMGDFYAQMAKGVEPADALRTAKLTLVHGGGVYGKPFYWAPFQLYAGRL
jgi:CHAT domain-containing protein